MNIDDRFTNNYRNAAAFLTIFERLLAHERFELEKTDVGFLFEVIASNLLLESKVYFDGATGLSAKIRKARQIEFAGKMWVGGNKTQWLEPFSAMVTDKRITKQGIWFKIRVGDDEAEGNLSEAFYLPEDADKNLFETTEERTNKRSAW